MSVLAHAAAVQLAGNFRLPDLEIELTLPIDVELGLSEEVDVAPVEPAAPPPVDNVAPKAAGAKPGEGVKDAGVADAKVPVDASDTEVVRDAGPPVLEDAGPPGARLPKGAQIALRVDMERIRQSPVVDDVRALLAAVPDWRALLDGSGIDPVSQLDRLLIATPDLQREKVVLAGRYVGDRQVVLDAVQKLAAARGVDASFRTVRGVQVGPWANADSTPRVIALIGPRHFTISREEDLTRVLALASSRTRSKPGEPANTSVADALLSMEDQEGLSLEVDGVEQFVRRGRRGIPIRLRLSAIERRGTQVEIRGRLVYTDATSARDAVEFWSTARDSYARNALVRLLGLSSVLEEGTIEQRGDELSLQLVLSVQQTQLILGYARELLGAKPPAAPPAAP